MLPTFEKPWARINTVLSNNGREYCGRPDRNHCGLFLQLEEFEHRVTRARQPQSDGFAEHLYRTLLDEYFRMMGKKVL